MRARFVAAVFAALIPIVGVHAAGAGQHPLPASMTCPATLAPADGAYSILTNVEQSLIYNLDSYHVACVWGLREKRLSFSVQWSEDPKAKWWTCGKIYNDGYNFQSKDRKVSGRIGLSEPLESPAGKTQQALLQQIVERFMDAAEVTAAPCVAAPSKKAPAKRATLQNWSVAFHTGCACGTERIGELRIILFGFKGSGTFRLSATQKPTAASGLIRLIHVDSKKNRRATVDLRVVGASAYRRSAAVERITLAVKVANFDNGEAECFDHDRGTVRLVDGYGVADDEFEISTVCGFHWWITRASKVTIR